MAGHSHWAGIKHKKGVTDQKRGQVFSKLLTAVTAAAKTEPNPDFNPRLRAAIDKARENKVPTENIERAVQRASLSGSGIEELIFEAYGPAGVALIIEVTTDNKNRAVAEVKKIISSNEAKWAEEGSVRWAFENTRGEWVPRFPQAIGEEEKNRLASLIASLMDHDDVQRVYTNVTEFEKTAAA